MRVYLPWLFSSATFEEDAAALDEVVADAGGPEEVHGELPPSAALVEGVA